MEVDPNHEIAEQFLAGFDPSLKENSDLVKEVAAVFSKYPPNSAIAAGKIQEKIAAATIFRPGAISADTPEKFRKIHRYVRYSIASESSDIAEAAQKHFSKQIEKDEQSPTVLDKKYFEIPLDVIFKVLGELGINLKAQIEFYSTHGFIELADNIKCVIYAAANGGGFIKEGNPTNLKAFLEKIEKLRTPLPREIGTKLKNTIETVLLATEQIKSHRVSLLNEVDQRLGEVVEVLFEKCASIVIKGINEGKGSEAIEKFEQEVRDHLLKIGFLGGNQNFKQLSFKDGYEPFFLSKLRQEIMSAFLENNADTLFEFFESPMTDLSNSHLRKWEEALCEVIKGKNEEFYIEHLKQLETAKRLNFEYPWKLFQKISSGAKGDERSFGALKEIFQTNVRGILPSQRGSLIDLFFGKPLDIAGLEATAEKAVSKDSTTEGIFSQLTPEDNAPSSEAREAWNIFLLDKIDFENDLPGVAKLMVNLLEWKSYGLYIRIFDYLKENDISLFSCLADTMKSFFSNNPQNALSYKNWNSFRNQASVWLMARGRQLDLSFYNSVMPQPYKGYEKAARLRFQNRADLPISEGLMSEVAAKLEAEALRKVIGDGTSRLSETEKNAALFMSEKFDESAWYADQLTYIKTCQILKGNESVISRQQERLADEWISRIENLTTFPNDLLIIPLGCVGHSVILTVIKVPGEEPGKEKISLFLTNTGLGISTWHPSFPGLVPKYATTAKVGEFPANFLEAREPWFKIIASSAKPKSEFEGQLTDDERNNKQIDHFYKTINEVMGKPSNAKLMIMDDKDSDKFHYPAKRSQYGDVCAERAICDVSKTFLTRILWEKEKRLHQDKADFKESYLGAEKIIETENKWIGQRFLSQGPESSGVRLKINKKGTRVFTEWAQPDKFSIAKRALMRRVFGSKIFHPVSIPPRVGESAKILKDLSKDLSIKWLKDGKTLESVKGIKGHSILQIAKKRFEYNLRGIEKAETFIQQMKERDLTSNESDFISRVFFELKSYGMEQRLLTCINEVLPSIKLESENLKLFKQIFSYLQPKDALLFHPVVNAIFEQSRVRELRDDEVYFLTQVFIQLKGVDLEPFLAVLKKALPFIKSHHVNMFLLTSILNNIPPSDAIPLFNPLIQTLLKDVHIRELNVGELDLVNGFLAKLPEDQALAMLKPILKVPAERAINLGEFFALFFVLKEMSFSLRSEIIKGLVVAADTRPDRVSTKEILSPFLFYLHLQHKSDAQPLSQAQQHLIDEISCYLSPGEKNEIDALFKTQSVPILPANKAVDFDEKNPRD